MMLNIALLQKASIQITQATIRLLYPLEKDFLGFGISKETSCLFNEPLTSFTLNYIMFFLPFMLSLCFGHEVFIFFRKYCYQYVQTFMKIWLIVSCCLVGIYWAIVMFYSNKLFIYMIAYGLVSLLYMLAKFLRKRAVEIRLNCFTVISCIVPLIAIHQFFWMLVLGLLSGLMVERGCKNGTPSIIERKRVNSADSNSNTQ